MRSQRATVVLLIASALLIVPGLLGIGATLPLAAVLAGLAGALWALREQLTALPTVVGYDLGWYARDSWAGAFFGVIIVLGTLGAPPPELRAFGGIVGLIGMVNYFLRPLYLFVAAWLQRGYRRRS